MTRPYSQGGFGVPNFELNYYSAHAHYAHFWVHQPRYMPQVAAEHWLTLPFPIEAAVYIPTPTRDKTPTTVSCTVVAWAHVSKMLDAPMLYSPLLPLVYHPAMPLLQETLFHKFKDRTRIHNWGDMYQEGLFRTVAHVFQNITQTPLETFLYIRQRQGIRSITPDFPSEPPTFTPLQLTLRNEKAKRLVSILYKAVHTQKIEQPAKARERWDLELGITLTDKQWEFC